MESDIGEIRRDKVQDRRKARQAGGIEDAKAHIPCSQGLDNPSAVPLGITQLDNQRNSLEFVQQASEVHPFAGGIMERRGKLKQDRREPAGPDQRIDSRPKLAGGGGKRAGIPFMGEVPVGLHREIDRPPEASKHSVEDLRSRLAIIREVDFKGVELLAIEP
ncbi:MAG TPA: hypothetical protein P5117_00450 [Spirochaetia bacterium]|nr:hypothetical protein [Spirochaetales bacterium]HRY79717.1 hypothetical protein [Spirochaetia bacterium]HRZ87928.1 hypothetical protein [Spirochaetia bacterium]